MYGLTWYNNNYMINVGILLIFEFHQTRVGKFDLKN